MLPASRIHKSELSKLSTHLYIDLCSGGGVRCLAVLPFRASSTAGVLCLT
jgi:hypothetical protein